MPGATIGPDKEIFDLNIDDYSQVMDLNLKGTVLPTLTFAKAFKAQGTGSVINFSSMSSGQALTRVLGYSNAKAAIDNFTRWMATEMALKYGDGVRVNAVAPGFFISNQNRALLLNEDGHLPSVDSRSSTKLHSGALESRKKFTEPFIIFFRTPLLS